MSLYYSCLHNIIIGIFHNPYGIVVIDSYHRNLGLHFILNVSMLRFSQERGIKSFKTLNLFERALIPTREELPLKILNGMSNHM